MVFSKNHLLSTGQSDSPYKKGNAGSCHSTPGAKPNPYCVFICLGVPRVSTDKDEVLGKMVGWGLRFFIGLKSVYLGNEG